MKIIIAICLVGRDLSKPGPVPDLLHVKDINVKVIEEKQFKNLE